MSEEARGPGGVTCIEIVELVTDYVEGALSLTEEEVPPPTMDALMGAFRNWRRD